MSDNNTQTENANERENRGDGRDSSGKFAPGQRPVGRAKGGPNKLTVLRKAFEKVFWDLNPDDRVKHLNQFAKKDPKTFYTLMSKLLPTRSELSGPDGAPITTRDSTEWTEAELLALINGQADE